MVIEWLSMFGVFSAITGLAVWYFKRRVEKNEAKQAEREKNQEKLILMMMQSTRANSIGIEAIARAVQRIPDANCNGDMKAALETMEKVNKKENEFLMERGINYIFE